MSACWHIIINPRTGREQARRDWDRISTLLSGAGISFIPHFTEYRMHAAALAGEIALGGDKQFIVLGGDGTLNEVVHGICSQGQLQTGEITLALIPVGTGNDWARTHNIPNDYERAIALITRGNTILHDIGCVSFSTGEKRYFINMCGMGFDAAVAHKIHSGPDPKKDNQLIYQYHIFTSLMGYKHTRLWLTVDGQSYEGTLFSMNVGICRYNGGGMIQLPDAAADDGLLDVTVIGKMSRMEVMRNVKKLYDGSFVNLPQVRTFRGKKIQVISEPPVFLEADGEPLGLSPFGFTIIPGGLSIIK